MVSFSLSTLVFLPLAANAYITGFTAPETATKGAVINATLSTASYSQNWKDFGIVWGLITPANDCAGCVGTQIGYTELTGTEGTSYPYTFTEEVTIPAGQAAGDYYLKAAIPRLIGVSFAIAIYLFFFSGGGGRGEWEL